MIVKIESSSATTLSAIDAVGDRVATSSGGSFGYLLGDLHGNQAAAFNAAGTAISDAFAYDAWGVVVASVTSALPTPWRYQGRILESAAGTPALYDFAARSYNPGLGTFTSLDSHLGSATNTALLNGYLYADANPTTLVDPDGHMSRVDDGGRDVATQGACGYDSFATHCGNGNTSTILKPLPRQPRQPFVTGGCGSDSYATHCGDGTRTAAPLITGGCDYDAYATHCNDGSRVVPAPATQSKASGCSWNPLDGNSCEAQIAGGAVDVGRTAVGKVQDLGGGIGNTLSDVDKTYGPDLNFLVPLGAAALCYATVVACLPAAGMVAYTAANAYGNWKNGKDPSHLMDGWNYKDASMAALAATVTALAPESAPALFGLGLAGGAAGDIVAQNQAHSGQIDWNEVGCSAKAGGFSALAVFPGNPFKQVVGTVLWGAATAVATVAACGG